MKKAFTLIEILIIVIIVGILMSSAVIAYRKALIHQRETKAQGILGVILDAERDYYNFRATGGEYTDMWELLDMGKEPSDHIYDYRIFVSPSFCIDAVPEDHIDGYDSFHITEAGLDDHGRANVGSCFSTSNP